MYRATFTTVKQLYKYDAVRFLLVGGLSFLVEFFVFTLLIDITHIKYTLANLPAMGVAIIFNYFLTRRIVFEPGRYNGRITFILFMTFTLAGVVLNQFFLWFFVEQLTVNIKLSKVIAVAIVAVFNYFTKKHIVF